MSGELQLRICPNPKCQKSFKIPIIISDNSKAPALSYYGCPNCFYNLDPTSLNILRKIDIPKKDLKKQLPEKKPIISCPKYLGYLYERPKNSIIPYECLECMAMSKCLLTAS